MTDPRPAEILRERHGAVEWVIFNRPHALNAMTYAMEDHLIDIFGTINADASVRAVVITGAAGKKPSFMAGQDFSYLAAVNGIEDLLRLEARGEAVIDALEALRVPTLAAIAGACVGAGALLAAACDVRIGAPSLRFGFPIARTAANALSLKSLSRIASLLGPAQTKELIFNPRLLGAPALMAACALREIVEDEAALLPRAQAIAEELAALAPLTLWATKQGMTRLRNNALANTKDEDLLIACYNSHDFHEGVAAFLEKRKPVWTGR
jgi:enoyl-CoA hydratase